MELKSDSKYFKKCRKTWSGSLFSIVDYMRKNHPELANHYAVDLENLAQAISDGNNSTDNF